MSKLTEDQQAVLTRLYNPQMQDELRRMWSGFHCRDEDYSATFSIVVGGIFVALTSTTAYWIWVGHTSGSHHLLSMESAGMLVAFVIFVLMALSICSSLIDVKKLDFVSFVSIREHVK